MNDATRKLYHIELTIQLRTPWLVQGNEPGRVGLDATLIRNHKGQLILPGSLLVGRIRSAWHDMKDIEGIDVPKAQDWFGGEGTAENLHARIWTNDLVIDNSGNELLQSTRIKIDETTEAVENGSLLLIEQTHKANSTVTFTGHWLVYLYENESQTLEQHLRAGLLWHSQLGAQRSIGFGELESASVTFKAATPKLYPDPSTLAQKRLKLQIDRPLCVATRNRRGNVFESSDIITGGILKGALARLFQARHDKVIAGCHEESLLAKYFDDIRITHAFPSNTEKRPSVIPLSLASVDGCLLDLAEIGQPRLIDGKAPAFLHDWKKEWPEVNKARGWGETTTHLRVRTQIDPDKRTAADEKLFAYQCKVPADGTVWLTDISLPESIDDETREGIWKELAQLLENGLGPIGKTDAFANVTFQDDLQACWMQKDINTKNDIVILMLNTPALLLASSQVADKTPQMINQKTASEDSVKKHFDLKEIYKEIFNDISSQSLTLSHFYASHSMTGGEFLQKRYMIHQPGYDNYQPFILTDSGSVFVLKVNNKDKAEKKIACWQKYGLTLPTKVTEERGNNWQKTPFIPQNGFGEIAINPDHGFHSPKEERLTACDNKQ